MTELKEVTDRFSIFKDGRTVGANGRRYLLESIQRMLESKQFLEGIRLNEHYGYFGHQNRIRKGLKVPESEVVILEGKAVNLTNVPSNVTTACTVDDQGIVTHTQRVLKSETGRVVDSMLESAAGGWSWAVGGLTQGGNSVARTFHGFDFVKQPNYVSLDRQENMMESAGGEELLLESMQGVVGDAAPDLLKYWTSAEVEIAAVRSEKEFLEQEIAMLESLQVQSILTKSELKTVAEERDMLKREHEHAEKQRESMLLEAIDSLPVILTEEQRNTLKTADDKDKLVSLLESIGKQSEDSSLPGAGGRFGLASRQNKTVPAPVNFGGGSSYRFPKRR